MAGISEEKRAWMTTVLGVDLLGGGMHGADPEQPPAPRSKKASHTKAAETPQAETQDGAKAHKDAGDGKVDGVLKALSDESASLDKIGFNTTQIDQQYEELVERRTAAGKLTDGEASGKALAAIAEEARDALEHARSLSKAAKDVMGKAGDEPDGDQKSAIYRKALEDLYHLKITVPPGMKNTHFDKMFDMFGSVPKSHVAQDKMKSLTYKETMDKGGEFQGAEIRMGEFGKANESEEYEIDGEKIPANSFKVTALHEIGHSIDEKQSIMKSNMASGGCGNWRSENVASITAAFLPELRHAANVPDTVPERLLQSVITMALVGRVAKPGIVADADWARIEPWLNTHCVGIGVAAEPWNNAPLVVGGRVYHESGKGEWWSYDSAARAKTRVTNYQWRSPWEWFAEIYAITWLAKRKPPAGVDTAVAAYMWAEK